jgi:hypothetical protein
MVWTLYDVAEPAGLGKPAGAAPYAGERFDWEGGSLEGGYFLTSTIILSPKIQRDINELKSTNFP